MDWSSFGFGVLAIPAAFGTVAALAYVLTPTNVTRLTCGCGTDWGNPRERGWRHWWVGVRMLAHDLSPRHRHWRREDAD